MNLNRINTRSNGTQQTTLPPISAEELEKIQNLCENSIDFQRLHFKNGPKDRKSYIRNKTAKLIRHFEKKGGRRDAVIRGCFKKTLEQTVPNRKVIITNDDWHEAEDAIAGTPDDFF